MLVHTLALPFGKINANRIYWEVGKAPVLCRQALAHVPAVFCRSSDSASPGDHHAWLDSKPRRFTDSSVILTPLRHYRERNTVQRGANQGRVTGSSMRHLQTRADPCNVRIITRNEQESGSSPLLGSPFGATCRKYSVPTQRAAKKQPNVPSALHTTLWQRVPNRAGTFASPASAPMPLLADSRRAAEVLPRVRSLGHRCPPGQARRRRCL
jgi:hypothetical protein